MSTDVSMYSVADRCTRPRPAVEQGSLWLLKDYEEARQMVRTSLDTVAQLMESLESTREKALVLKDELAARQQSNANHALYVLSMVSALFLPFRPVPH